LFASKTGELTADILADAGIKWAITGHSERRVGFGFPGETSAVVGQKTKNAVVKGLSVIACIGEQLADRQNGTTLAVVSEQLAALKVCRNLSHFN
jgi:triosephosphate isomerase